MQTLAGLTSPLDIAEAVTRAQKMDRWENDLKSMTEKFGANVEDSRSFGDVLLEMDWDLLRPDKAIFDAMDANWEAQDRQKRGDFTTSAFDSLIGARVAGAVGSLYSPDDTLGMLQKDDPFAPGDFISQYGQRQVSAILEKYAGTLAERPKSQTNQSTAEAASSIGFKNFQDSGKLVIPVENSPREVAELASSAIGCQV